MKKGSKSYEVFKMLKALGSDVEAINNNGNPDGKGARGFYGKFPDSKNWKFLGYTKGAILYKFENDLL